MALPVPGLGMDGAAVHGHESLAVFKLDNGGIGVTF
jgi:hypothetical protein